MNNEQLRDLAMNGDRELLAEILCKFNDMDRDADLIIETLQGQIEALQGQIRALDQLLDMAGSVEITVDSSGNIK